MKLPTITVNKLKTKVVSEGDGLYTDSVEANRYVYKGGNPNNYIWIDENADETQISSELYRIISIETDNTLKIRRNNSIGTMVWDPGYSTNISGITEANSTAGTRYSNVSTNYCYESSEEDYKGCKSWGSSTTTLDVNENNVTTMPKIAENFTTYNLPATEAYMNTYLNTTFYNGLASTIQEKIVSHIFNIGPVANNSNQTLATDVQQEKAYKWRGKIGLMNITDYVKASSNTICSSLKNYSSNSDCYNTSMENNYLYKQYTHWTINPAGNSLPYVWDTNAEHVYTYYPAGPMAIEPVFFLSSNIELKGQGTQNNPYYIVDE